MLIQKDVWCTDLQWTQEGEFGNGLYSQFHYSAADYRLLSVLNSKWVASRHLLLFKT